jgi:hypothetical protein
MLLNQSAVTDCNLHLLPGEHEVRPFHHEIFQFSDILSITITRISKADPGKKNRYRGAGSG